MSLCLQYDLVSKTKLFFALDSSLKLENSLLIFDTLKIVRNFFFFFCVYRSY